MSYKYYFYKRYDQLYISRVCFENIKINKIGYYVYYGEIILKCRYLLITSLDDLFTTRLYLQ